MAHNLHGSRFVGARGLGGWHALGTIIPADEQITVADALKRGGIDYTYEIAPAGYLLPSGDFVETSDKRAVLRSPTADDDAWAMLGFVGDDYRVLQNAVLAEGLDKLAQQTGWTFETVGALGRGETVFMTLRTGKRSVFGDEYDTYVAAVDGKCANRALTLSVGRIRMVCQNTVNAGERAALHKVRIAHDALIEREYAFWTDLIGQLQSGQDEYFAQLERLASVKITDKQAKRVIEKAFPHPAKGAGVASAEAIRAMPELSESSRAAALGRFERNEFNYQWDCDKVDRLREASFEGYVRLNAGDEEGARGGRTVSAETLAHIAETPYAALQSVIEVVDWAGKASAEVAARSALFGDGAQTKDRAFRAAAALVK